jgi:hypothetical protein
VAVRDGDREWRTLRASPRGDIDVQDITFQSEVTDGEDDLKMIVYYHAQPRRR